MYYDDHAPPHFHAVMGGWEIKVAIADPVVVDGKGPQSMIRRVLVWAKQHRAALALNWVRCQSGQKAEWIS
jgi:hypothetical protein